MHALRHSMESPQWLIMQVEKSKPVELGLHDHVRERQSNKRKTMQELHTMA